MAHCHPHEEKQSILKNDNDSDTRYTQDSSYYYIFFRQKTSKQQSEKNIMFDFFSFASESLGSKFGVNSLSMH